MTTGTSAVSHQPRDERTGERKDERKEALPMNTNRKKHLGTRASCLDRRGFVQLMGVLGASAAAGALLSACAADGPEGQGNAGPTAPGATVKISVGGSNTGPGAGLLVLAAMARTGEEFGLDLDITPIDSAPNMIAALQSKKVDIAGYSAPAPLSYLAAGNTDLSIIGGLMSNYESIITLPENAVLWKGAVTEELIDGLKLGSNRTNSGDIALRGWLAEQGFDLTKITFSEFDTPATVIEAVKNGSVDVGIVNGAFYLPAEAQGLVNARFVKDVIGRDFICCRQLVRTEQVPDVELWTRVEKALIRAWQIYRTDEEATLDALTTFIVIDREVLRFQLYGYGDLLWSPDPAIKSIKAYWQGMQASGYVDKGSRVVIDDFIDASAYKRALDELSAESPDDPLLKELRDSWSKLDT
ncbi:MAG: hypothetical protein LBD25_07490 [Coriobacteriales bacterium]|jgi:ABC-type nitrate/sulfonate/bicarbonate transport system substrate-binding protein|nr:hypothetical protein [Coriobacteriales bacterium]